MDIYFFINLLAGMLIGLNLYERCFAKKKQKAETNLSEDFSMSILQDPETYVIPEIKDETIVANHGKLYKYQDGTFVSIKDQSKYHKLLKELWYGSPVTFTKTTKGNTTSWTMQSGKD